MKYKLFFSLFLILLSLLLGCGQTHPTASAKPTALASIPPYAYFVQKIAADKVNVYVVVPPGANPHLFEPSPREFEEMRAARVWIQIGESFEKKMTKSMQEQNPDLILLNLEKYATLSECAEHHCHDHLHEELDRHIWLSPALVQEQVRDIANILATAFPQYQSEFATNLTRLLEELQQLDRQITEQLARFRAMQS